MNLDHLNPEQRKAATHVDGPLLILAGAGSGKTATMTHRIAYLIEQGVSPYQILAVTFTNKAAGEMRERVEKLVGRCPGMWIMTFHAMSLRILRDQVHETKILRVDEKDCGKGVVRESDISTTSSCTIRSIKKR